MSKNKADPALKQRVLPNSTDPNCINTTRYTFEISAHGERNTYTIYPKMATGRAQNWSPATCPQVLTYLQIQINKACETKQIPSFELTRDYLKSANAQANLASSFFFTIAPKEQLSPAQLVVYRLAVNNLFQELRVLKDPKMKVGYATTIQECPIHLSTPPKAEVTTLKVVSPSDFTKHLQCSRLGQTH